MSRRMLLLVALAISASATLLTQRWLSAALARGAAVPAAAPTVEVLVAARPLDIGSVVDRAALRWAPWPVAAAGGLVTRTSGSAASLNGAVVRVALVAGEPVTPARVVRRGDGGTLAAVLGPDARAVTIAVTPASGMAGFVLPGDRVDLILTETVAAGGVDRHVSHTILRGLRVLGTDQRSAPAPATAEDGALAAAEGAGALANSDAAPAAPTTVTLETDAKGAEMIAVAGELGKLSLSLRGLTATEATDAPSRTWDSDATQIVPHAAPVAAAPTTMPVAYAAPASAPATATPSANHGGIAVLRGITASATDMRVSTTDKP